MELDFDVEDDLNSFKKFDLISKLFEFKNKHYIDFMNILKRINSGNLNDVEDGKLAEELGDDLIIDINQINTYN